MSPDGHPQRGEVIAGKYLVEDVVGAGGMGIVIAARHVALRQRVAVKFLLPQAARIPEASERFLREARAVVAIQSEHVAKVLDVGTLDTGAPYMVMEFLAGTDLSRRVKHGGPIPPAEVIDYVLQACEAIAEAHALGIVHRDLKPANLFLTARADGSPLVKVLDFGLSKMAASEDASLTATGFVMGSPHYMSPEQIRSLKHVDWRTDIWALGVILYELLTSQRPFDGPSLPAISASIVLDSLKPMRALGGEIPPALEAVVNGCLEKDPARRWQSLGDLARALAPFAPPRSWTSVDRILRLQPETGNVPLAAPVAPTSVPPAPATGASQPPPGPLLASTPQVAHPPSQPPSIARTGEVAPTTVQSSAWGNTRPMAQRRPILWIAAGLGVAIPVLGVVAWVLHARAPETPPAQAATTTVAAAPSTTPPAVTPAPATAIATATEAPVAPALTPTAASTPTAIAPTAAGAHSAKPSTTTQPAAPQQKGSASPAKGPNKANPLDRSD